jgi:hypothetical protein
MLRLVREFSGFEITVVELVAQNSASWNQIISWLHRVERLRGAA